MIKISVDEATAYDMLAILEIKILKSAGGKVLDTYILLKKEIIEQIGITKHSLIFDSQEYYNLLDINQKIFELVDLSKKNKVTPKEVDEANYHRHLAKKTLQEKFFTNGFQEVKIGYENVPRPNNQ